MSLYRGERWQVSYGVEATYGAAPTGSLTATELFGVFDSANLPDPQFDHQAWWMMNPSNRNYYIAYKGKATSAGGISNIVLLEGRPLFLPIADKTSCTGADKASGGGGVIDTADVAIGGTTIGCSIETNWANGDICQIDTGAVAEVIEITTVTTDGDGTCQFTMTTGCVYAHAQGIALNEVEPPYVHGINETVGLSSIRVVCTNYDDTDITPEELTRWFVGGKVNRATYQCDEGGMLMMSLDDIQFKMPYFLDADTTTTLTPWYDADSVEQSLTLPSTEPYYFSMGVVKLKAPILSMAEVTIPSIKNFRLTVNNSLTPKYYIADNAEKVPYQIYEGRRSYSLSLQVDLIDSGSFTRDTPWLELLNQGMDTTFKGAAVELTFTRDTGDYIKFITPADYTPVAGGDSQGALVVSAPFSINTEGIVSVTMSMLMRNLKIEVSDELIGGDYPA